MTQMNRGSFKSIQKDWIGFSFTFLVIDRRDDASGRPSPACVVLSFQMDYWASASAQLGIYFLR
jgi:hypothetical protein